MQMIDVMKRLAEIDSANIVKENAVAECGIMPEMNMYTMEDYWIYFRHVHIWIKWILDYNP